MNSDLQGCTAAIWDQLLLHYHETMINSLAAVTGLSLQDARLQPFRYCTTLQAARMHDETNQLAQRAAHRWVCEWAGLCVSVR